MTRFFTGRFGGVRHFRGPVSGLIYTFSKGDATPVADERDARIFLLMGTPDSGAYIVREVDALGNPVGPFPPIDFSKRQSMIDPKLFPSDGLEVTVKEWRTLTEDLADPWLYYHHVRTKLHP